MSNQKGWFRRRASAVAALKRGAGRQRGWAEGWDGGRHRLRPAVILLEDRCLLSGTFTVTSTADSAPANNPTSGTLRWAVEQANAATGFAEIIFDSSTPMTIPLAQGPLELSNAVAQIHIALYGSGGTAPAVTISGGEKSEVFQVDPAVTASFWGVAITGGSTIGNGGGLVNRGTVTLLDCTISGNTAGIDGGGLDNAGKAYLSYCNVTDNLASKGSGKGGGVDNENGGTLSMTDTLLSGNSASSQGGGLENDGSANLSDCTITGNSAGSGGGLNNTSTVILTTCTVSGNSAGSGGGVVNSATATLTACTVTGNSASAGGGLANQSGSGYTGKSTLSDTIVAGNSTPGAVASDIGGTDPGDVTGSYNLVGPGGSGGIKNGVGGNIVLTSGASLGLAPLEGYGGPIRTIALLPGSPAIGAGTAVSGVTTDQRGFPLDSPVDIGAFQFQAQYRTGPLEVDAPPTEIPHLLPGQLGLLGAVDLANVLPGVHTIAFDPSVFATPQTITLTAGEIPLSNTTGSTTIDGPVAGVTISGDKLSRVFQVDKGATAIISGVTITGGSTTGNGGGLYNQGTLALTDCTVSGNSAGSGSGLFNAGTATLTTCTISGNSATLVGGGVDNSSKATLTGCTVIGNSATNGGGGLDNVGTATLMNCLITVNTANSGGGLNNSGTAVVTDSTVSGNSAGSGGGLVNTDSATLSNCTISGNSAASGGGLVNSATAKLTACTVSGNSASQGGAGLANQSGSGYTGKVALTDTIIAGNTTTGGAASDIGGTDPHDVTGTHNLIGSGGSGGITNGSGGNIVLTSGASPGLTALGYYGGPTPTMALLTGSPAIRAGIAVSGVTTDQRGFPLDSPVDIGAFQSQPGTLVVNSTADGTAVQPGQLNLRGAVDLANVLPGAHTITFDPTVFAATQTITLTAGAFELSTTSGSTTIDGPAAGVTVSGDNLGRVFRVDKGVTATISGLTISGGSTAGNGGGLYNQGTLTLIDCTLSGNSAKYGAGLDNTSQATLTGCTVSNNFHGGLYTTGPMTLVDCTVANNTYGDGLDNQAGTAKLIACTVSGNSNFGLANYSSSSATGTITLTDTIVAGNFNSHAAASDIGGSDPGDVTGSHNLIGSGGSGGITNGSGGNIVLTSGASPGLTALGYYGGPTPTMALLTGSPAIGAGLAVSGVTTDQRGFPLDSPIDIGAFRSQTGPLVVDSITGGTAVLPGQFSLREAVDLANALVGSHTITFDPAVFSTPRTITLTSGEIDFSPSGSIAIDGPGAGLLTVSGGGQSRVFAWPAVPQNGQTVSISGLTITGGSTTGNGGGLLNDGFMTLTDVKISGSSAGVDGGGLYNRGRVTLVDCTLSGNSTTSNGGGLENDEMATLIDCTVADNTSGATGINDGGGLDNEKGATMSLTGCTISGNTAGQLGFGAGLSNYGTVNLADCTISGNTAETSGSGSDGGGLEVEGGTANLTGCTLSGNFAYEGGGLDIRFQGTANLTDCTLSGNSGGGLSSIGTANLTGCTIDSNTDTNFGGGLAIGYGLATLTNCTISGNSAPTGGGLINYATVDLTACTISGNTASVGGGLANHSGPGYTALATLTDTIVAGNKTPGAAASDIGGTDPGDVTGSDDLIGTGGSGGITGGANGNLVGVANPGLGSLANNGGLTQTIALESGSPAIGAGIAVSGITTDQRGLPRPSTGAVDIGAFETQSVHDSPPIASYQALSTIENVVLNGQVSATDADNNPLTYSVVAGPTNGGLTLQSDGAFTYTPASNDSGPDSFTFQAFDGIAYSNVATVSITVYAMVQPPVANNDSYSTNENTALAISAPGVLSNDNDPDNKALTAVVAAGPAHGSLTLNSNGSFTYTPATNFFGTDSFTYKASDGTATSDTATVTLTVVQATGQVSFLKKDTTTEGNWIGTYGADGSNVIGDKASYPSYATVTAAGEGSLDWTTSTTDPRALQNPGGSGRIAGVWFASTRFTVDIDLTGGPHDLELYFLDWDSTARAETVQISAAGSGTVLDTATVSSFHAGVYLDWQVSGNLVITITKTAGANAVLSGIFFNPAPTPTSTATFLKKDTTTEGSWIKTYGADGSNVIGDKTSYPSYATVTASGEATAVWATSTTDPRALQNPGGSGRIAGVWFATTSFTVDINLTDGQAHDLELYFLDWDSTARAETVQISAAGSGTVLDTATVSSFHAGVYLDWQVSGNLVITITKTAGANAVLSGIFFNPPTVSPSSTPAAIEVGRDSGTQEFGMTIMSTLATSTPAIGTLDSRSGDNVAPPPAPENSTPIRELVHDVALEVVSGGRRRIRSVLDI